MVVGQVLPIPAPFPRAAANGGRKRKSPALTIAIAASIVTHLAVGFYLYRSSFQASPLAATQDASPPIEARTITLEKPPPTAPQKAASPAPSALHAPPASAPRSVDSLPVIVAKPVEAPLIVPPFSLAGNGADKEIAKSPPAPKTISDPTWLSRPDAAQVSRAYPPDAERRGLGGGVTLNCGVSAAGSVTGCEVTDESPIGWGFGKAALALSRYFRMKPRIEDGQVVGGARVRIPIQFRLAND